MTFSYLHSEDGLEGLNDFDSSIGGQSGFVDDFFQDVDSVHPQTVTSGTSFENTSTNALSPQPSNYAHSDAGDFCDTNQLFPTDPPVWGARAFQNAISSHGYDTFAGGFEQASMNQLAHAPRAHVPPTVGPPYYTDMLTTYAGSELHTEEARLASTGALSSPPQIRVDHVPNNMQSWVQGTYNAGDRNIGVGEVFGWDWTNSPSNHSMPYDQLEPKEDQRSESSINTSNTGHSCPNCPTKYFDTKDDLRRHRRYHNHKKHACECGESFVHPKDLKRHQKTHTSVPGLLCPVDGCTSTFKAGRRDNMKRHVKNKHPGMDFDHL